MFFLYWNIKLLRKNPSCLGPFHDWQFYMYKGKLRCFSWTNIFFLDRKWIFGFVVSRDTINFSLLSFPYVGNIEEWLLAILQNANNICSYLKLQMVKVTTFGTTIVYVRGREKKHVKREEKNMVGKTLYTLYSMRTLLILTSTSNFNNFQDANKISSWKKNLTPIFWNYCWKV